MENKPELDSLIIDKLLDLDDAAKHIEVLGTEVWSHICEAMEDWASENGWGEQVDPDDPWVTPTDWRNQDGAEAWFYLDYGPGDTGRGGNGEPYFKLSRYVGAGGSKICLWLGQNVVGNKERKLLANEFAVRLSEHGISLSDSGNFYAICTLDPQKVIAALSSRVWDDAMLPIRTALDRVAGAKELFSELLEKAKK